jgi:hypothetical protein
MHKILHFKTVESKIFCNRATEFRFVGATMQLSRKKVWMLDITNCRLSSVARLSSASVPVPAPKFLGKIVIKQIQNKSKILYTLYLTAYSPALA